MPSTPPATTPESVCSKPAVPLGQPAFSVPGAPSVFHQATCKVWKSLHAAAFYSPGSPLHGASRQHWGQLVRLARPACSQRTAARRRSTGQTAPIGKSPALALECRGFFCSALMEAIPERHFHFPHQLPQKEENSPLCGLLPGAGGLAHRPAPFRRTAPGKPPPSENPRYSLWNAGDFLSIYSCCTGGHFSS